MGRDLEKQKELLAKQKAKVEAREKLLKIKERKLKTQTQIKLGALVEKAKISNLSEAELFGAFLQVALEKKNKESLERWRSMGSQHLDSPENLSKMILTFPSPPSPETKKLLKSLGFKFHSFRDEWYGSGSRNLVRERLNGSNVKIEAVDE